jgi:hypothetical protein
MSFSAKRVQRLAEKWGRDISIGLEVVAEGGTVKRAANKRGLRERSVWRVMQRAGGREYLENLSTRLLGSLEQHVAKRYKTRRLPGAAAGLFLLEQLRDGPRSAAEMKTLAAGRGIKPKTLFRARQRLGVDAHRIGGAGAHWVWELSAETKRYFGVDN